jgi:putative hydrolases of HD superfamily
MNQSNQKLINFFYEVGVLRKLKRSYILHMLQDVETVAEHSHRASVIAFTLAIEAGADPYKAMSMSVLHDLSETRTGDSNWHQKEYINQDEDKATQKQLALMGKSSKLVEDILSEYHQRQSLESKIAKDADNIEYILSLKELELQGNKEAERRLYSGDCSPDHFYTTTAKKLFKDLISSHPNDWYQADRSITHKKYLKKVK